MISVLFSIFLAQAPVASPPPSQQVASKPADSKTTKVCKTDPNYTGTRVRKRLCLTQAEWAVRSQGKNAGDLKTIGAR